MENGFFAIPETVLKMSGLTAAGKITFGALRFRQNGKAGCWPSIATVASDIGASAPTARAAIRQLEAAALLTVQERPRSSHLFRVAEVRDQTFLRVRRDLAAIPGMNPQDKLTFSAIEGLSLAEGRAFPHQERLAAMLGISRRSVQISLDRLEKDGRLQIDHRGGGRKRGNRYTPKTAFLAQKVAHEPEKTAQFLSPKDKSYKELKKPRITAAPEPTKPATPRKVSFLNSESGLSAKPTEPQSETVQAERILVAHGGVHPGVAAALARQHSVGSIESACKNAILAEAKAHGKRRFRRAAYIVGTLNQAAREGHGVTNSRAVRQHIAAEGRFKSTGARKTADQLRSEADRQKKLLLGVA